MLLPPSSRPWPANKMSLELISVPENALIVHGHTYEYEYSGKQLNAHMHAYWLVSSSEMLYENYLAGLSSSEQTTGRYFNRITEAYQSLNRPSRLLGCWDNDGCEYSWKLICRTLIITLPFSDLSEKVSVHCGLVSMASLGRRFQIIEMKW